MASRILRVVLHYAVYVIGISVLLFAILVSTVRLALPDIGIYRGKIEGWVSRFTGYPVAIHSMQAEWEGWTPTLHLADIDLLDKEGRKPLTHFESAQIRIAPLATLLARRFVPKQLEISGFDLTVARLRSGAIHIEGLTAAGSPEAAAEQNEIEEWLLQQDSITIRNGTIEWVDYLYDQEPLLLTDVTLSLRSDSDRVQVEGSANLPPSHGKRMEIAFDGFGNLVTTNWSGELYVYASDVIAEKWYATYRPIDVQIRGGSTDLMVWSTWNEAALTRIEGRLKHSNIAASVGNQSLQVEDLGYRFVGQRTGGGGWQLDLALDNLLTEHGVWPEANIMVHAEPVPGGAAQRYELGFDYLKLDDLAPLIARLQFLPADVRNSVRRLAMSGDLRHGRIAFDPSVDPERQFAYDVQFEKLTSRAYAGLPAIQNAAGRAAGNLAAGTIFLDNQGLQIVSPDSPSGVLDLQEIRGAVHWRKSGRGIDLNADRVDLRVGDLQLGISGKMSNAPDESPQVELAVAVGPTSVATLIGYLPQTPDMQFREWLTRTVHSGQVKSGQAVLRGRLADFPFSGPNGRFQAELNVENAVFEYSTLWPVVEGLHTDIVIDGRQFTANLNGGRIFDAEIETGTIALADIFNPERVVQVSGTVSGIANDLKEFVEQSPLANTAVLVRGKDALAAGEFKLDLELSIPVRIPDRKVKVDGVLNLVDAELKAAHGPFSLEQLAGEVAFTGTTANGSGLSARFRGREVSVDVAGSRTDAAEPPSITIHGHADRDFISRELIELFPGLAPWQDAVVKRISGETDWHLQVSDPPDKLPGSVATRLLLTSNLQGLGIDLPAPLGKPAHFPGSLEVERTLDAGTPADLLVRYGNQLNARVAIDPENRALRGAQVHFGPEMPAERTEDGVLVDGTLDQLDVQQWWPVLRGAADAHGAPSSVTSQISADLHVTDLRILNRPFADVGVKARRSERNWEFELESERLAGKVLLPAIFARENPITLDLARLIVEPRADAADAGDRLDPAILPAIDARIADFHYEGKAFGSARLTATPIETGLSIDPFDLQRPDLEIHGIGQWVRAGTGDRSNFTISVRADQIDEMLQTFGYDVAAVKKGETELSIVGEWAGTPMEFALSRLDGTLDLKIRKGQLLDVEPKAGRLFGLLSIQTLPRRLSLDFSDLFGKGLAFDVIEGRFQVADGNAFTNDLSLRGPSANLAISGRTGLAAHDYDQIVTVTPQISDSLPVASALFGPLGMGIGAVLYLAGTVFESINSGIDRLLRYQYTITGSWDDPVIEKFELDAQASG